MEVPIGSFDHCSGVNEYDLLKAMKASAENSKRQEWLRKLYNTIILYKVLKAKLNE